MWRDGPFHRYWSGEDDNDEVLRDSTEKPMVGNWCGTAVAINFSKTSFLPPLQPGRLIAYPIFRDTSL